MRGGAEFDHNPMPEQHHIGQKEFLDVLGQNPEVNPLPECALFKATDTFRSYVDRVTYSYDELAPGVYLTNPEIGSTIIPDQSQAPERFGKIFPSDTLDSNGLASSNGFFAQSFVNPDGLAAKLAFRPFDKNANANPLEDFARNNATRFLGIENTQTIGFYKSEDGKGGTISLLNVASRSLDLLNTDSLTQPDSIREDSLFGQLARELAYIHRLGLAHGDVALRNVMRRSDGGVFLIDWGRAQELAAKPGNPDNDLIVGTAEHDVASLFHDFVWLRASQDGADKIRGSYRQKLIEQFGVPYLRWREYLNDTAVNPSGRLKVDDLYVQNQALFARMQKM